MEGGGYKGRNLGRGVVRGGVDIFYNPFLLPQVTPLQICRDNLRNTFCWIYKVKKYVYIKDTIEKLRGIFKQNSFKVLNSN